MRVSGDRERARDPRAATEERARALDEIKIRAPESRASCSTFIVPSTAVSSVRTGL
jgi:hypothetical protein